MGRGPKPAKNKAKPAVPRKSRKDEDTRVRDLEKRLADALAQQAATAEILGVISSTPTDVRPVFEAIARNAVRLCGGVLGAVFRFDGEFMDVGALHGYSAEGEEATRRAFPTRPERRMLAGRAVLSRATVHVPDILADPEFDYRALAATAGWRSLLVIPMLRGADVLGTVGVTKAQIGPFRDQEIALLKTFADQAVIAIENVRLLNETKEALDRQTATSEILRVISRSPTDLQPVFDSIAASALRLCDAKLCTAFRFDGELIYLVGSRHVSEEGADAYRDAYPSRPGRQGGTHRAILTRTIVHIPDIREDAEYELRALARANDYGCVLSVPMLRDGNPVGAITVGREAARPFSTTQIELLKTFADQAVIAIENVRLFTELQEKNRALTQAHAQVTESLEHQTATSEVLKIISRSTFDLQPVLENVVESATRLCAATRGHVFRFDGEFLRFAAAYGAWPTFTDFLEQHPTPLSRGSISGRAAIERRTIHVRDVVEEPDYEMGELLKQQDYRAVLAVPMLREGALLGVIALLKSQPEPFTDKQIELVTTFADQAVIAIENVRLFKELEARTQDLTRSVGELRALSEVGQAITSTLNLDTVLATIVSRAIELSGTDAGTIWEYDQMGEQFHLRAALNLEDDIVGVLRATPLRRGEGTVGRLADTRAPIQVDDISEVMAYRGRLEVIVRSGYRAILSLPLLREDQLIGALTVNSKTPREFSPAVVDLLTTFATQSALAIQNARLFRELADKGRQLEAASQHKSEFLANMSHELRTPLNAIIGFSEVLTDRMFGELNEKQEEYLKDIYASGTHLLSLINDILDLSKIEAGRMELELTEFDLPTALDNALMLIRERAGRRSIALHTEIDGRLGQIQADERKVRQVVLNLLSNAIKFTPEGGRIDVGAVPKDGFAEVSVHDTGIGIAPEDQEKVFEEFRQVGTAAKKVEGTGLGLTLCRKFVELHGGRIWVKSQLGAGSTFTFTIPVHRG